MRRELLEFPERDLSSGARPVVALDARDPAARRDALESAERSRALLERRGREHGEWVELDPAQLGPGPWNVALAPGAQAARWHAARPIVLHGLLRAELPAWEDEIEAAQELHARLAEGRALRAWVAAALGAEPEPFALEPRPAALVDVERDLERVLISSTATALVRGRRRRVRDLWVKSSWLSSFSGEDSLRVRLSFGREEYDDASRDALRHRLVHELATRLIPESALLHESTPLADLLRLCTGERVLFTQHIAYWNSPGGGALFHHDAFADDDDPALGPGQLGVCYAQLSGRTAWLALSTDDLVRRVQQFGAALARGEWSWVRAQLYPRASDWRGFEALCADPAALARELGLPGCGQLAGLVNRGPEFSSFLADGGHAALLEPGDVILLPNHGLERTAMHSVFCAADERAYSLSLALRAERD